MEGQCGVACVPDCAGRCGGADDGCGGACDGACPVNQVCVAGACLAAFGAACASNAACTSGVCACQAADCAGGGVCADPYVQGVCETAGGGSEGVFTPGGQVAVCVGEVGTSFCDTVSSCPAGQGCGSSSLTCWVLVDSAA